MIIKYSDTITFKKEKKYMEINYKFLMRIKQGDTIKLNHTVEITFISFLKAAIFRSPLKVKSIPTNHG